VTPGMARWRRRWQSKVSSSRAQAAVKNNAGGWIRMMRGRWRTRSRLQRGAAEEVRSSKAAARLGVASVHNMKFIEFQQQHLA
jgi:hypothetical protein